MLPETAAHPDTQPMRILAEPRRWARRRITPAIVVSSILLAGVVLLILVLTAGIVLGAWRFTVIDTGSMRPALNPGDVAVLTSERIADLKRGQIVAFHPPGEPRLTVIHRVFSIQRTRNGVIIQTKGDANNATDPWHARLTGNTVWHENLKAPKLGYLAVWSQHRPVRLGVLIVIVISVLSMLLGAIWRPTARPRPSPAPWPPILPAPNTHVGKGLPADDQKPPPRSSSSQSSKTGGTRPSGRPSCEPNPRSERSRLSHKQD